MTRLISLLPVVVMILFSCRKNARETVVTSDSISMDTVANISAIDSAQVSESPPDNLKGWRGGYFQSFKPGDTLKVVNPSGAAYRRRVDGDEHNRRILKFGSIVHPLQYLHEGVEDIIVNSVTQDTIAGRWVKAVCERDTGFVFSAFIGRLHGPTSDHPDLQLLPADNAIMLTWDGMKEYPCTNNFDFRPDFKYYGLYQTDEGLVIRQVDLLFFIERRDSLEDSWYERYVIKGASFFDPLYIIGSRMRLPEKYLAIPHNLEMHYDGNEFRTTPGNVSVGVKRGPIETLYVKDNGHEVFSKRFAGGQMIPELKISADINGDTFMDNIFTFHTSSDWSLTGLLIGSKDGVQFVAKYENFHCN
jgi:hypothetical protein